MPSTWGMSTRTMSPSSLLAAQWAQVAPTLPAPMIEIFARRIHDPFNVATAPISEMDCETRSLGFDYGQSGPGFKFHRFLFNLCAMEVVILRGTKRVAKAKTRFLKPQMAVRRPRIRAA